MTQPRTVNRLDATDAAYIAGILDGEGTIALTRRHRNENRQLEISISNTDLSLLRFVKERVGAGRITRKRTYQDNHSRSATYTISNRQALVLLEQVSQYLRTYKAQRAELVLQNYVRLTPRNGFYTPEIAKLRSEFVEGILCANPLRRHKDRVVPRNSAI
jgi:hypothetical protein